MKAKTASLLAVLFLGLALVGVVLAQPAVISRSVMGGGGEKVSAGNYVLNGTLSEPVASHLLPATNYGFCSGFWCGALVWWDGAEGPVYLPIILKNY